MGFDPALANDAIGILRAVFGDEWLRGTALREERGAASKSASHRIGTCLQVSGPEQVAEILELAEYLTFIATSSEYARLVQGVRTHFDSTQLQLAFGYRLARARARSVEFEPPVAGGRVGDIRFRASGETYIAECYSPAALGTHREIELLVKHSLEAMHARGVSVSILAEIKRVPASAERKRLVRTIVDAVASMQSAFSRGRPHPIYEIIDSEYVFVSISFTVPTPVYVSEHGSDLPLEVPEHPAFSLRGTPYTFVRTVGIAPPTAINIQNMSVAAYVLSHFMVWLPDTVAELAISERLERLAPKLERKLVQTRHAPGTRRVLVVQTGLTRLLMDADPARTLRARNRFFKGHKDIEGILLVKREWDVGRKRYAYLIVPWLNESSHEASQLMIRRLLENEYRLCVPPCAVKNAELLKLPAHTGAHRYSPQDPNDSRRESTAR